MLGAFRLIRRASSSALNQEERTKKALEAVREAASSSPVFDLIHRTYQGETGSKTEPINRREITQQSYSEVNISPFDDPLLVNLDDKILLHKLLSNSRRCKEGDSIFWPQGYILPDELAAFELHAASATAGDLDWILKERNGYGSHGNRILTASGIMSRYKHKKNHLPTEEELVLCQQIVHPPMLLHGRKFSLRIYVVYFARGKRGRMTKSFGPQVLLSNEGLVKFAADEFTDDSSDGNQCMTNSGRGDRGMQRDLQYLKSHFDNYEHNSYEDVWRQIKSSVLEVMQTYLDKSEETRQIAGDSTSSYTPMHSLPKILGFDYMLDRSTRPFLLEVNRFPGLEPRSAVDADVKHAVVHDAWVAAARRLDVPTNCILDDVRSGSPRRRFSLEKLNTK